MSQDPLHLLTQLHHVMVKNAIVNMKAQTCVAGPLYAVTVSDSAFLCVNTGSAPTVFGLAECVQGLY